MEIKKTVSDLRNRYDETVKLCAAADAVIITRNGTEELAVMSAENYRALKIRIDKLNDQLDGLYAQIKKFERTLDTLSIMSEGRKDLKNRTYSIDEEIDRIMKKFKSK